MPSVNQANELAELFIRLITERLHPNRIPDREHITGIFTALLGRFPFINLWDAVYFSQEDEFWSGVIISINRFDKHVEKLVAKGVYHRCPMPNTTDVKPVELPKKSLMQTYLENRRCQT